MGSCIDVNVDERGIAILTMRRSAQLNALNPELIAGMHSALEALAAKPDVKAVVLTGAGRGFCAGADLSTFLAGLSSGGDVGKQVADSMERAFNPLMALLMEFPKPVIAAVNGIAAGGGAALALCADITIAGRSAAFKFVQVPQLGCVADLGGNWLLSRTVGRSAALGAILLGETISAEQAERRGMIWEVVADPALIARALDLANRLAAAPHGLVAASRRLVDAGTTTTFRSMLELERRDQHEFASRPELVKVVAAFMKVRGERGDAA